MWLTDEEVYELTRKKRYPAQLRALRAMGIEYRVRGDGSPGVARAHVEKVFGGGPSADPVEDFSQYTTDHVKHPVYEGMPPWDWYKHRYDKLFLSISDLRALKAKWEGSGPLEEGIYFLWMSDDLLYVGQSVNIDYRLSQHSRTKEFDHFSYVSCPKLLLDKLELEYITALNPPLNVKWRADV